MNSYKYFEGFTYVVKRILGFVSYLKYVENSSIASSPIISFDS